MFIRTQRLFLRPGWAEDWSELFDRIADEGIVRNLSRAPWPYTPRDARDFVALPASACCPRFLVTLPDADGAAVVGGAGLGRADDGRIELGYWIARDFWGRGIATEAASAVLDAARVLGHRRVIARHFVDNPASGRVLRKLGFRPTGAIVRIASAGRAEPADAHSYELDLCAPEGDAPMDMAA
ncbi:GNAT family N-acetyltransferase [Parablastomonas sp. CN1-191]|uniref:GNAT family N-acetyltransferase n=1 Tax=Parablastomonas sp. CN1-191 TaxID=3400908 RepID=UPI003BF848CF